MRARFAGLYFGAGAAFAAAADVHATASRSSRWAVTEVHVTAKRKLFALSVRRPSERGTSTPNRGSTDLRIALRIFDCHRQRELEPAVVISSRYRHLARRSLEY